MKPLEVSKPAGQSPRDEASDGSSVHSLSSGRMTPAWPLFVACTAATSTLIGTAMGNFFTVPDVEWYLKIAQGNTAAVIQPFAFRQLGPLVCRALTFIPHIGVGSAYVLDGVVSLLVLLGIVGFMLRREGANPIVLAAVGGLAF